MRTETCFGVDVAEPVESEEASLCTRYCLLVHSPLAVVLVVIGPRWCPITGARHDMVELWVVHSRR